MTEIQTTLRRIGRGLYDWPGFNKFTQKPTPPDPRSVIDAVERRDQARMLVGGMTVASKLFWAGRPAMRVFQAASLDA